MNVSSSQSAGTVATVTDGPASWKPSLQVEIYGCMLVDFNNRHRQRNLLSDILRLATAALPGWCNACYLLPYCTAAEDTAPHVSMCHLHSKTEAVASFQCAYLNTDTVSSTGLHCALCALIHSDGMQSSIRSPPRAVVFAGRRGVLPQVVTLND